MSSPPERPSQRGASLTDCLVCGGAVFGCRRGWLESPACRCRPRIVTRRRRPPASSRAGGGCVIRTEGRRSLSGRTPLWPCGWSRSSLDGPARWVRAALRPWRLSVRARLSSGLWTSSPEVQALPASSLVQWYSRCSSSACLRSPQPWIERPLMSHRLARCILSQEHDKSTLESLIATSREGCLWASKAPLAVPGGWRRSHHQATSRPSRTRQANVPAWPKGPGPLARRGQTTAQPESDQSGPKVPKVPRFRLFGTFDSGEVSLRPFCWGHARVRLHPYPLASRRGAASTASPGARVMAAGSRTRLRRRRGPAQPGGPLGTPTRGVEGRQRASRQRQSPWGGVRRDTPVVGDRSQRVVPGDGG